LATLVPSRRRYVREKNELEYRWIDAPAPEWRAIAAAVHAAAQCARDAAERTGDETVKEVADALQQMARAAERIGSS